MGIFDKNKEGQKESQAELDTETATAAAASEPKKTTPDEGKTFDKDTVFVCVQDCWQNKALFRRGDKVTGRKCPPWFVVQKAEDKEAGK